MSLPQPGFEQVMLAASTAGVQGNRLGRISTRMSHKLRSASVPPTPDAVGIPSVSKNSKGSACRPRPVSTHVINTGTPVTTDSTPCFEEGAGQKMQSVTNVFSLQVSTPTLGVSDTHHPLPRGLARNAKCPSNGYSCYKVFF